MALGNHQRISNTDKPAPNGGSAANGAEIRIKPNLRDLMSLARAANHLPSWTQRPRARHSGAYLSSLRGRGMEYDESRPYQAGDDVRTLDWRVTARTGKPHTKLFREERERPVYICIDLTRTMRFATRGVFKSVVAARAAALLAWKAQQSGDRIGGIVFDDVSHHEIEPTRGKAGVIRLLKAIVATNDNLQSAAGKAAATSGNKIDQALERLDRLSKPGSIGFVLSDFRALSDQGSSHINLIARHNDLMMVHVADDLEAAAPAVQGRCAVSNGERTLSIVLGDEQANEKYRAAFIERQQWLQKVCSGSRVRIEQLMTSDEPLLVLQRLLR